MAKRWYYKDENGNKVPVPQYKIDADDYYTKAMSDSRYYDKSATDTLLGDKVSKTDITQSTGTSTTAVMSQKAVTEISDKVDELWKEVGEIDATINNATIVGKKNVPMCEDYDTGVNYNTYRSLVFFTSPAANDVEISSVKVCISRNVNTYDFKVKIIECEIREGDAQPIYITNVSEELQYSFPSVLPSNIEISLTTPFTIHAGKYVAIIADNDWLGITDKVQVEKYSASTTKVGLATSYEALAPDKRISNLTSMVSQSAAAGIALYNEGRKLKDFAEKEYVEKKVVEAKKYTDEKIAELDVQTFNTDDAHVISDYNNDIMAHVSNIFFCGDGYIYVPYSANLTSHGETIESGDNMVAKISKVNLCNLSNPIIKTFAKKGEKFGGNEGFHQSDTFAVYDTVLIDKDEDTFATCSVLTPNGTTDCGTYYSTINKNTLEYAKNGVQICKLKYVHNGTTYNVDMNVENLLVFAQRITGNVSTRFGNYPIITRPIPYDGYIYSYLGGCNITSAEVNKSFCGAIIRTNDYGQTWEVVASNPSLSYVTNMWEGAVLPYNGKVYCLLRAKDSKGRLSNLAMYYDLVSNTWSNTIQLSGYVDGVLVDKMTDPNTGREVGVFPGDARPFIYQRNGCIYLFAQSLPLIKTYWSEHSGQTNGVYRSHVRIYKCDTELNILEKKSIFGKNGLQYVSLCDVEDKIYFGFTEDKRHFDKNTKGNISIMEFDFL